MDSTLNTLKTMTGSECVSLYWQGVSIKSLVKQYASRNDVSLNEARADVQLSILKSLKERCK